MRTMLGLMLAFSLAPAIEAREPYPYQRCFEIASRMHDVPVDLLLAVAATESNLDADARSHADAHGIMQIQWPGTARHLGVRRVAELYNPCLNIELGARYLRELLDANGGDVERALAAYNYGPTRITRSRAVPAGARTYAAKVASHRARVINDNATWVKANAVHELLRFDSGQRARRLARLLGRRIENARFEAARRRDGSYAVTMHVGPNGLSTGDALALDALGWREPGR